MSKIEIMSFLLATYTMFVTFILVLVIMIVMFVMGLVVIFERPLPYLILPIK